MAFQGSTEEIKICFPFCCLGTIEPAVLAFIIVLWDLFVFVTWWIYSLCLINDITVAPIIVSFIFILLLFPVVWDCRDPRGRYIILKYYSVIRIAQAAVMSVATITFFILIFVFIANHTLERDLLNKFWALGLFLYFAPVSIIHWGTVLSFFRAQRLMRAHFVNETTTSRLNVTLSKLNNTTSASMMAPPYQSRIEMNPTMSRLTQI